MDPFVWSWQIVYLYFVFLQVSGKLNLAKSALSGLENACKTKLLQDPKTYKTNKKGKKVPNTAVLGSICPNNCNGKGRCVKGKCRCFKDYTTSDCSVSLRKAPKVVGLQAKGVCDLRKRPCKFASVYGSGFVGKHLKCHIQKAKVRLIFLGNDFHICCCCCCCLYICI